MHAIAHPARNSDPITSHEAAEHIEMTGVRAAHQRLTATAVAQYPGCTSLELSRKSKIDRYTLARRLSECEEEGTVKRGQARRCSISGRTATTWYPPNHVEQLTLEIAA